MSGLRRFLSRLENALFPERAEGELEREVASHLALLEDEYLSRGMTPGEARVAARRALGGVEQVKELHRDARSFSWLDDVRRDVSFALRTSLRNAGFTSVVLATLALGIGANTTIFSVVNAVLLRPLPFPDPERLVVVSEADGRQASRGTNVSYPNFEDWSRLARSFEQLAAIHEGSVVLRGAGEPVRMQGAFVSAELFELLGVRPLLGRTFDEADERVGAAPSVVISHDTWQRRFGGDPGFLGEALSLDEEAHTVIGVMPRGFRFPDPDTEVWMSLGRRADEPVLRIRRAHVLTAVARLAPSATLQGAQADMDAIAARLQAAHPGEDPDHGVRLTPMLDVLVAEARPGLLALLGGVGFVLLISCANVANLLLARAARRRREIAMRRAIGATPGRIVRQLLIESLLLAAGGGVLALLVAEGLRRALVGRLMDVVPRAEGISIDWQVLAFTAAVSLATGVLFGLVPALRAAGVDVNRSLKDDGGRSDHLPANSRLRSGLVVAEIAISLVLVVGAGLMITSFWRVLGVDPGFQPDQLVTLRTSLPPSKYAAAHPVVAFYGQLPARLEAIPQVVSVSAVNALPIRPGDSYGELTIEGRPFLPGEAPAASFRRILPNYFRTMGIRLVQGREFDARDTSDAPRVVIVSESLAREHFPGGDALGTRIKVGPAADEPW